MPRKAKAVLCRELDEPVVVEEIEVDSPRAAEVMIKVAACGVCHSDLSATNGTIAFPPPLVLGHEGAGVIVEVGEGVTDLEIGDYVVSAFVRMCGRCRYCVTGKPQLCDEAAKALYTLPDGTTRARDAAGAALNVFSGCGVMAQYATLHVDNVVKIREDMPLDRAALVSCGVMTGIGAVFNTARVEPGSSVVVFGAGGVGLNVVQGCAIAGATTIIAVDIEDHKLELAKRFGATHTLKADAEQHIVRTLKRLTEGGPDYAFDCIGRGSIVADAYRALRKGGTAVVVGIARSDDLTSVRTASLAFEEKTLTGSYFGSARPREDFPKLIEMYRRGQLELDELITRRYTIDEAARAFEDLAQGRNARGIIMF